MQLWVGHVTLIPVQSIPLLQRLSEKRPVLHCISFIPPSNEKDSSQWVSAVTSWIMHCLPLCLP